MAAKRLNIAEWRQQAHRQQFAEGEHWVTGVTSGDAVHLAPADTLKDGQLDSACGRTVQHDNLIFHTDELICQVCAKHWKEAISDRH